MKNILLIQFHEMVRTMESERDEYRAKLPTGARLDALSAFGSYAWDAPARMMAGYDALIFGGARELCLHGGHDEAHASRQAARETLERVKPLVHHALGRGMPILGVCFGHQLIAEMHGGEVFSDEDQKKAGSYDVRLEEAAADDSVFGDFPRAFVAQYGHKDSVTSLPTGATLLGSGAACRFSILRYGENVYTTQFHPELSRRDVLLRFARGASYLPPDTDAARVTRESPEAARIVPLFLEKIVSLKDARIGPEISQKTVA